MKRQVMVLVRVLPGNVPLCDEELLGHVGLPTGDHIPIGLVVSRDVSTRAAAPNEFISAMCLGEEHLTNTVMRLMQTIGVYASPHAFRCEHQVEHLDDIERHWFTATIRKSDLRSIRRNNTTCNGRLYRYMPLEKFWRLVREGQFSREQLAKACELALLIPPAKVADQ